MLTYNNFLIQNCKAGFIEFQELKGNLLFFDFSLKSTQNILKTLQDNIKKLVTFGKLNEEIMYKLVFSDDNGRIKINNRFKN